MEMVHFTDGVKGAREPFDSGALAFHQVGQAAGCHQPVTRSNTMANPRSSSLSTSLPQLPQNYFQQRLSLPQMEGKNKSLHTPTTSRAEGDRGTGEFVITRKSV